MAYSRPTVEDPIGEATSQVATALRPELPAIGDGTADYIEAAMPELATLGVGDLVRASCHANSSALLDALIRGLPLGVMAPSAEVMQRTRALVRHGLDQERVVHGYQIGLIYWCERWTHSFHGPRRCRFYLLHVRRRITDRRRHR